MARHYVAVTKRQFFVCSTPAAAQATLQKNVEEEVARRDYGASFWYACDCDDPGQHCDGGEIGD